MRTPTSGIMSPHPAKKCDTLSSFFAPLPASRFWLSTGPIYIYIYIYFFQSLGIANTVDAGAI